MKDIHARVPINITAAKVVLSKGEHFDSKKIVKTNDSEMPLRTRPITHELRANKGFNDVTGHRFGYFTVVGLSRDFRGWVVRCVCGMYSTRHLRSILNPANTVDKCEQCRHLAHLKNADHWRRTGRDLEHQP